jgi:hypothetical protein
MSSVNERLENEQLVQAARAGELDELKRLVKDGVR